jgi:hypothetical protein
MLFASSNVVHRWFGWFVDGICDVVFFVLGYVIRDVFM